MLHAFHVIQIFRADNKEFICKNCKYKEHQCFACGKLGSSEMSAEAEVGMAEFLFFERVEMKNK